MGNISVREDDRVIEYGLEDLTKFHGYSFHCGLTIAFRAMQAGFPRLAEAGFPQRRDIRISSAFNGPGARDAFEMVTRAVTDARLSLFDGPEGAQAAPTGRFAFEFSHGETVVSVAMRAGQIEEAFLALARKPDRSASESEAFAIVRNRMIDHMRNTAANDIFETSVSKITPA